MEARVEMRKTIKTLDTECLWIRDYRGQSKNILDQSKSFQRRIGKRIMYRYCLQMYEV